MLITWVVQSWWCFLGFFLASKLPLVPCDPLPRWSAWQSPRLTCSQSSALFKWTHGFFWLSSYLGWSATFPSTAQRFLHTDISAPRGHCLLEWWQSFKEGVVHRKKRDVPLSLFFFFCFLLCWTTRQNYKSKMQVWKHCSAYGQNEAGVDEKAAIMTSKILNLHNHVFGHNLPK